MSTRTNRREFILGLAARAAVMAAAATGVKALLPSSPTRSAAAGPPPVTATAWAGHPEPRAGVDASRVLSADDLGQAPHVVPVFDRVREIPHVADGLRCYCGCADLPGYRSLLSCFEGAGMARYCEICQAQAMLAHNRWKEGQTLQQIRRATDARFADAIHTAASERPHCAPAGRTPRPAIPAA